MCLFCCAQVSVQVWNCAFVWLVWNWEHVSVSRFVCSCVCVCVRESVWVGVCISVCVLAAVRINQYWSPGCRVPPRGRMLMLNWLFLLQSQLLSCCITHTHTRTHCLFCKCEASGGWISASHPVCDLSFNTTEPRLKNNQLQPPSTSRSTHKTQSGCKCKPVMGFIKI